MNEKSLPVREAEMKQYEQMHRDIKRYNIQRKYKHLLIADMWDTITMAYSNIEDVVKDEIMRSYAIFSIFQFLVVKHF